jgi:hypothetical protein
MMTHESYQGRGALLYLDGRHIDWVDYAFAVDADLSQPGRLSSSRQQLPKFTVLRLQLAERNWYVHIQVVQLPYDRQNQRYDFALYLAAGQPADLNNVVMRYRAQHDEVYRRTLRRRG